ncbi:hypothetical protein YTPLAS18_29500 [Nitrospira sp.]|nr:hypothetical protein YTPLAS18_29500 [Nitrospira sp.]
MIQTIEHADDIHMAIHLDAEGEAKEAKVHRTRAEWARMMAVEMRKQAEARAKMPDTRLGEAVPDPQETSGLRDTLTVPHLAAVEASLDRSRLLTQDGLDVAAMALDAANSIQAQNSIEKMLAHQLAAVHKQAMQQMSQAQFEQSTDAQAKRLHSATRCLAAFREGLIALHRVRQGGRQNIRVQYVHMGSGAQAVISNIESNDSSNNGHQ